MKYYYTNRLKWRFWINSEKMNTSDVINLMYDGICVFDSKIKFHLSLWNRPFFDFVISWNSILFGRYHPEQSSEDGRFATILSILFELTCKNWCNYDSFGHAFDCSNPADCILFACAHSTWTEPSLIFVKRNDIF